MIENPVILYHYFNMAITKAVVYIQNKTYKIRIISQLNLNYYHIFYIVILRFISEYHTIDYTTLMSKLNSQFLLFFILPLAFAGITNFWDMSSVDQEGLQCLKINGYLQEVFLLAVLNPNTNLWQTPIDPETIYQLGTKVNLVISTTYLDGHLSPQLEAHKFARQFQTKTIQKLWISIADFQRGFKPSCQYLRIFALYLHLFTKKEVGFQSQYMFWEDLFGDSKACAELGDHSLYLSFNNFQPFGGWTTYQYYDTYRPVPVCNYPGMQVFRK